MQMRCLLIINLAVLLWGRRFVWSHSHRRHGHSGARTEIAIDIVVRTDATIDAEQLSRVIRAVTDFARLGPWTLVHCWSHLRRRSVKLARNSRSPMTRSDSCA